MQAVAKEVKNLLEELSSLEILKDHYLAGGTNLALRYNHRTSIDLDFFVHRDMDQETSNYLNLRLRDTFKERFESNSVTAVGVFGFIDKVKVDFVNYPYPLLNPVDEVGNSNLANPLDIAGMKINAIVGRGTRKDFFDLHQLLEIYSLESILENYKTKYGLDNIQQAGMAIGYFGDAEDGKLRDNKYVSLKDISWEQIKKDITNAMKDFNNSQIVKTAIRYHNEVDYPDKIQNITAYYPNGALSKAFNEKFGIRLSKQQLEEVDKGIVKKKDRGISM